ncbi:MAG: 50S ribosomal protein L32e [Candidatus Thorarchaeota archaeon]|jgi:large subunit ribosomal protein L32e
MSKKPKLSDLPGVGAKIEEKLREAGIKTVIGMAKAKADKLAAKVDGLSEAGAAKLIEAAEDLVLGAPAPKETKAKEVKPKKKTEPKAKKPTSKEEKPKKKPATKKTKPKAAVKPKKAKKKKPAPEVRKRDTLIDQRVLKIAVAKKRRKPKFRAEGAHRWIRVSDRWRKLRGIDSATREKRKGRIAMVSAGYRSPKSVRGLHPSRFIEVSVHRPADLESLDPDLHAIRIGGAVGLRKRQEILAKADTMLLRVLNPGAPESVSEEDLFSEIDEFDDLEVD